MSFEYSGDPATSNKDAMRFLIGDTVEANALYQDEELEWLLTQESNIYLASAVACETVASRFRALAQSKSVGGLSISYGDRASQYAEQGRLLRVQAQELSDVPVPIWTAGSKAEKELRTEDDDANLTDVTIGIHDNPGTAAYGG